MNKNIVEQTLYSIDNIDRLTDLAAISIYNTSHEALDKYDIMQEHATQEYVQEEFIQESVLAGVLIGAGIIGVAVSAFFIIRKIINSGAKGDKSKSKDTTTAAGIDLTKPEEAKKFLAEKQKEIDKWADGTTASLAKSLDPEAAKSIHERVSKFSDLLTSIIEKEDPEEIKQAAEALMQFKNDAQLPQLTTDQPHTIEKNTKLEDLVNMDCVETLAKAYTELEKKIADVEKKISAKTKKEGSEESATAVDAEGQKAIKEICNVFQKGVNDTIVSERGYFELITKAIAGAKAPAPQPTATPTAAENKPDAEPKPADGSTEAKDNGNPESSTNSPESLKGQLNATQAKAQAQQTSDLNGKGTPAGGSLEGVQTPPTTGIDQPTSQEQKRQQTQAELSEYNKLNEERAELENKARYTNTENAALKNYMIKLGIDNDKINEYLYKTYINDKQGLIDNLRVIADNTGVSTDELDRIAEMIANNSKKVPINTEAPLKETPESEPKLEPKSEPKTEPKTEPKSVDPSSLTAKVDAIENDDAELNKICVQVYPKSAITNPENTRTKVKDMLETIAVYFDEGNQDGVIDEIIKGAVTKCNTDGTQNKKAFVNAYADLYKRYSTCAKVLGVALPAAKPEKIDNDERINSYFTKGVDATNAEYDAKEAPTDFHDAEYNAEDDLVDILTSEAMKVIQNGEDENEIDAALNMYIQHFMDKDAYPFTEDELNQIKAKAKKAAMEKLKSSELGNGFNYDYSQDKTEPEKKYTIPSDITDAFADANDNDADKEYNNIMTVIDKGEDPTSLLNMVNNVGTYSNDTKKAIFAAIKQAHPEINVPEVKPMLSMDDMINGFDNTDNTKQTNGAESQNVPTPAPTPIANPAPTAEPQQLNAALNMPVNNAQEALRRRNETKAQAELNRYASLAAAAKTDVTPQVLEGLALEVIDKAKAADRGEDVKGNTANIKSRLKNIYNHIAGPLPFRLGASKEKRDALALARTYLHDRMAAEGVDKYFVEMEEPEITYQNLIMECDIAIAREEKLKLITEQK